MRARLLYKTQTMVPSRHPVGGTVRQQLIQVVVVMTLLVEVLSVASLYLPDIGHPIRGSRGSNEVSANRRQDYEDDDDMDSNASAPYQNQDDGSNGSQQSDGYEEAEPDGPYGETPREEEGQADLERFFDDHLGASEREGMDKENLPSNIIERLSLPASQHQDQPSINSPFIYYNLARLPEPMVVNHPMVAQASRSIASYSRKPTNVEMRYLKLPDNRVIIVHHEERDTLNPNQEEQSVTDRDARAGARLQATGEPSPRGARTGAGAQPRRSDFGGDQRIEAAENDDMERIYVTRAISKPFKIEALGGYDPEQDFQDAERDLADDHRESPRSVSANLRRNIDENNNNNGDRDRDREASPPSARDINFDDGETDTMFNDASEMDEITFAQDDPYQTDLEAEMRSQAFDKPTPSAGPSTAIVQEAPKVRIGPHRRSAGQQDDSEGSWMNDGVDEMDIPSQDHQDKVLERAAKQQEAAAAEKGPDKEDPANEQDGEDASPAETASEMQEQEPADEIQQQEDHQIDSHENQRMPNANYLRNLTDEPEDYEESDGL